MKSRCNLWIIFGLCLCIHLFERGEASTTASDITTDAVTSSSDGVGNTSVISTGDMSVVSTGDMSVVGGGSTSVVSTGDMSVVGGGSTSVGATANVDNTDAGGSTTDNAITGAANSNAGDGITGTTGATEDGKSGETTAIGERNDVNNTMSTGIPDNGCGSSKVPTWTFLACISFLWLMGAKFF